MKKAVGLHSIEAGCVEMTGGIQRGCATIITLSHVRGIPDQGIWAFAANAAVVSVQELTQEIERTVVTQEYHREDGCGTRPAPARRPRIGQRIYVSRHLSAFGAQRLSLRSFSHRNKSSKEVFLPQYSISPRRQDMANCRGCSRLLKGVTMSHWRCSRHHRL